jgi:hypothetical protein
MTGIPNQEIQNAQKAGKEAEAAPSKKKRGVPGEKEKTATASSKASSRFFIL